jgi:hypothetical protein
MVEHIKYLIIREFDRFIICLLFGNVPCDVHGTLLNLKNDHSERQDLRTAPATLLSSVNTDVQE